MMPMRALAAACVLAAVSAQEVQLTSRSDNQGNSDLRVTRHVTTDLAESIARIESTLIPEAINLAQQQAFNATLTAMTATTAQMLSLSNTVNNMQASMNAQLSSIESRMSADASALRAIVSADVSSMRASIDEELSEVVATVSTNAASQSRSIGAALSEITASQSSAAVSQASSLAAALSSSQSIATQQNRTVTQALASKADATVYMWTGGCSSSRNGGGWQEYCLNQVHFQNLGNKFRINSGTRFLAREHAFFTVNFWHIFRTSGWHHIRIFMNNEQKTYGYNRESYHEGGHSWRDGHMMVRYPVLSGRQMWASVYVDSWTNWHGTNARGEHARITCTYDAPYSP